MITAILGTFEQATLNEMDNVKLMNRTDKKFMFTAALLPEFLQQLAGDYKVLCINSNIISTYKTLYFDTQDLKLYMAHHNGRLNRYKVRYRNYVESKTGFLEIKFKNNKGRTVKERIIQNELPLSWTEDTSCFLSERTPYNPLLLKPAAWVNYQRITLMDRTFQARVTIDINLEFVAGSRNLTYNDLVIVEVKQALKNKTPALDVLKQLRVKEGAISKYCLGITQMYPHVKKNNFKEQLTAINKITYDKSFSAAPGI